MVYEEYYSKQAGNGIIGYSGIRYQKGNGFFGRLLSGAFLPWIKKSLKFLGKNALSAGVNIGADLLKSDNFSKENIKEVAKKHGRKQGLEMADNVIKKSLTQSGNGRRRKTKRKKANISKKPKLRKNVKGQKSIRKTKKRRRGKKRIASKKVSAKDFLSV